MNAGFAQIQELAGGELRILDVKQTLACKTADVCGEPVHADARTGLKVSLAELRKFGRSADHDAQEVQMVEVQEHVEEGLAELSKHAGNISIGLIQRKQRFGLL